MSEHILHTANIKRLERSRTHKLVSGVSAGLGRYFDITPAVFRLGFVVLTLLGGAGILVYLAAILVIPKEGEERSIAEDVLANRREHPWRLVALGLVAVAIFSLLARADTWPTAGAAWFLILLGGFVLLWTTVRRRRGLLVGIVTVLALLLATAVAAVTAAFAWFDVSLDDGVGKRTYAAATTDRTGRAYEVGIGRLELDLSHVRTPRVVHAHVGLGELHVVVPRDARVLVNAHVKAGSIDALGRHEEGTNTRVVTGDRGGLVVDARVGAGQIEVERAR
jgi:phage shock protein PspC (stress-responsive transcriptional regulator)